MTRGMPATNIYEQERDRCRGEGAVGKKPWPGKVSFGRMTAVAALSISVLFLLAFGGQILEIYRLRAAQAVVDSRLSELRAQKAALEATLVYVESDDYAEQVARAELNKIRPGDQRSIIITREAPAATATPTPTPLPPPAAHSALNAWWELLFGS